MALCLPTVLSLILFTPNDIMVVAMNMFSGIDKFRGHPLLFPAGPVLFLDLVPQGKEVNVDVRTTAQTMILMAAASAFAWLLTVGGLPQLFSKWMAAGTRALQRR